MSQFLISKNEDASTNDTNFLPDEKVYVKVVTNSKIKPNALFQVLDQNKNSLLT